MRVSIHRANRSRVRGNRHWRYLWNHQGGHGSTSELLGSGLTVAALVTGRVNSLGSVINPTSGVSLGSPPGGQQRIRHAGETRRSFKLPHVTDPVSPSNTTIGVIATDAALPRLRPKKSLRWLTTGWLERLGQPTRCSMATPYSAWPQGNMIYRTRQAFSLWRRPRR